MLDNLPSRVNKNISVSNQTKRYTLCRGDCVLSSHHTSKAQTPQMHFVATVLGQSKALVKSVLCAPGVSSTQHALGGSVWRADHPLCKQECTIHAILEYMIHDKLLITGYEGLEFSLFQLIVEYPKSQVTSTVLNYRNIKLETSCWFQAGLMW